MPCVPKLEGGDIFTSSFSGYGEPTESRCNRFRVATEAQPVGYGATRCRDGRERSGLRLTHPTAPAQDAWLADAYGRGSL
jgi:hypothetical protein